MDKLEIVIAGVGGQGSLLASKILGALCVARGLDVKVNEVHGMSQRGGSVVTMVRAGKNVASPLVTPGTVDFLIAFERLEAVRYFHYCTQNAKIIISSQSIKIAGGNNGFSAGIIGGEMIDAPELARLSGDARCANVVLLGAAANYMDFTDQEWHNALSSVIKPKFIDVNLKAFTLGKEHKQAVRGE